MRLLLRTVAWIAAALVALLVTLVLYLSFGDLNRHKERIESYLTHRLGRPFAIDGRFALELFPEARIEAGQVRIGNAPWASAPQLLQVGRIAVRINPRSLLSGPVDIRLLELRDVEVNLERNAAGDRNWVFGKPGTAKPVDSANALTQLPFAVRRATVSNLKAIQHTAAAPDRVAIVDSFTVTPTAGGLLELEVSGALDGYAATLTGQLGPLESLLTGRDIRLDVNGRLGNLRFAAKGGFARLDPLDGSDLQISINNPDLGPLLKNLRLPAIASGKLDVAVTLKDAGKLTALDLAASAGDVSMRASGKLTVLGLRDSDLTIKAEATDAARLARLFDIKGVPEARLNVAGRFITSGSGLALHGVHVTLGGYEARVDGTLPARRNRARKLNLSLTVPSLADFRTSLPPLPLSVQGAVDFKPAPGNKSGIKQLLQSRDIHMDLTGAVGNSRFKAKGQLGQLDPLDAADLAVSVSNPDGGTVLEKLRMPAIATGTLDLNATLKKAGKRNDVDINATLGDVSIHSGGTLAMLGLRGSDLTFQAEAADAARLAQVFDIKGVPAAKLAVSGHVATTEAAYSFDGVHATLDGHEAHLDGSLSTLPDHPSQLRFDLSVPSLSVFKAGLPPLPLRLNGEIAQQPARIALTNLSARFGSSVVQGAVTLIGSEHRRIEADLTAPLLDLTPFLPKKTPAPAVAATRKQFLFGDQPLPYARLGTAVANVHFTAAELRLARGVLHGVDTTLALDQGRLQSKLLAHGGFGGSVDGSMDLTPVGNGSAAVKVDLTFKDVRTGFASGSTVRQEEVPPIGIKATLTATGATAHQLASTATGTVLFTQGAGKSRSDLLNLIGSDIIAQLLGKLNPFAAHDPYTQVDCMVARVDISNGNANAAPVLLQTRKVAITASGTVDLKTEKLLLNFNTRPREGIGISPGMFTNPFLDLTGTLMNPSIGVGTKGVTSGALAAATGGVSVLAKGVVDRVIGETNQCTEALAQAQRRHQAAARHRAPGARAESANP